MPMALTGLDMHNVINRNLARFLITADHSRAGNDHQDLIAAVRVPPRGGTFFKVYQITAKIFRISVAYDRLSSPAYGSP